MDESQENPQKLITTNYPLDFLRNRGFFDYKLRLFSEGYGWDRNCTYHNLNGERVVSTRSKDMFGGIEEFFRSGSNILELGSGGGRAIKEMSENYSDVSLVGFDMRYGQYYPIDKAKKVNYLAGRWQKMPFGDNSFDRVISVESFPVHYGSGRSRDLSLEDAIDITFKEITRISRQGGLWRGTPAMGTKLAGKPIGEYMVNKFLENGWEIYVFSACFVAKLVKKQ